MTMPDSPAAHLLAAATLAGRAAGHAARLAGAVRATPRLARVLGEALRLGAVHRFDRARREVLGAPPGDGRAAARRVRELCEELRGGVLKLGQIASARVDLLPPAAVAELALLQDRVPPLPAEVVEARVAAELGRPLSEVFARFGPAIAAASLAQVHEAELADGTEVAVKVLVPGIDEVVEADLAALRVVASACAGAVPGVEDVAAEIARAVRAELDCRAEAAALDAFRVRFAARDDVVVPRPVHALTTRRVLVMERLRGARLVDFLESAPAAERDRVVRALVDCFAEQILEHGVFHGDPHPGNFLVVEGPRLALLDFGCVMQLPDDVRRAYAALVVAVLSRDSAGAARQLERLGFVARDPAALTELAGLILEALGDGVDLAAIDPAAQLARAVSILGAHPLVTMPQHFVLVGRVLASLGGVVLRYPPRGGLFDLIAPRLARAVS
jgi:ubiquinone biosynthesis protein